MSRPYERKGCKRKIRYSRIGAELALSKWGGKAYRCPFCGGFHLTKGKS